MNEKFLKPYNPAEAEDRVSLMWDKSGYFNPDNLPEGEAFSIVLPPPNVTGTLHTGHALMLVVEDIMIRFERMRGKKTLWLPGTDHAGIATQSKVEGIIYKEEGKRRHDIGRPELVRRIEKFAQESHDTIVSQVKAMGASVDWSREAFTLDETRNKGVRTAFKKMYDDGIIYRGYRIVNWDVKGQTTISDDEIVHQEQKGKQYTFRYSKDFPISIATTRPETKVGDVAVAVHPEDERYKQYIGKTFNLTFADNPISIRIVADQAVDPAYGTGAVGVTPCHSQTDWEIAERHDLPKNVVIINEVGKMTERAGPLLSGKKVAEARVSVVEWLRTQGLLEKEEDIVQNISTAERTGGVIEPLPKLQWFVGVNRFFKLKHCSGALAAAGLKKGQETTLKELMLAVVKPTDPHERVTIIPDRFEKTYLNWIGGLRDWCISRQIWYGHRVPVWYRTVDGKEEIFCGIDAPKNTDTPKNADIPGGSKEEWKQDEDTLDTWFSSGLWTFSTLGWPDAWDDEKGVARVGSDLALYHPTNILETGYDIIFFWVARMILMSTYLLGDIPFRTVYLHGLVRDGQGRKMSKSLGNIIDPVDMKKKYGADALRMSLIVGTGPGNDSRISEDKIKGYRNFANKLWNIARFILTATESVSYDPSFSAYTPADKKLLDEQNTLIAEITQEMSEFKYYIVSEKLYHYAWHTLADVILEESKTAFIEAEKTPVDPAVVASILSRKQFLLHTLYTLLKVLHPFIPFVTEEIWSYLPESKSVVGSGTGKKKDLLLIEKWPV